MPENESCPDNGIAVSVVVPVFNSASSLPRLLDRLESTFSKMELKHYELIFIEDGSSDDSWTVLQSLQKGRADKITAIQLMRNFGQHNAIMCGLKYAKGKYIVTIDDDLQNPPEEIEKLINYISENELDLVYGEPRIKKHSSWRNLGSQIIRSFYHLVFRNKVNPTSFRIIRRELVDCIFSYDLNFTYIDGLLAWNTKRIGSVPVEHNPRQEGKSGYSLRRLLILSLNLFTNFSLLPLQVVSFLGIASATFGFAAGTYYLLSALVFGSIVPGYASTITAILILGGMQLLALGMIGEYIGRLHLNVNRKPQYSIRNIESVEVNND